jgi:hypothetical protein
LHQVSVAFDASYNFHTDAQPKKDGKTGDPDTYSLTLARYHQLLWSKPLPDGRRFELTCTPRPPYYLNPDPGLGIFDLASDTVINTYHKWKNMHDVVATIPEAVSEFYHHMYTVGGMMIFPAKRSAGSSINQERGFNHRIRDRFDLTLECIRGHYAGDTNPDTNPMTACLLRYAGFFSLFRDFRGYVDFFLLQDIVGDDGNVKFFTDGIPFESSPLPRPLEVYLTYRERAIAFIQRRGERMVAFVDGLG